MRGLLGNTPHLIAKSIFYSTACTPSYTASRTRAPAQSSVPSTSPTTTPTTSSIGPISCSVVSRSLSHRQPRPTPSTRHAPQRHRPVLDRRKVERHPKRRAQLVVACIAFADRRVGIIDSRKDACPAQLRGCPSSAHASVEADRTHRLRSQAGQTRPWHSGGRSALSWVRPRAEARAPVHRQRRYHPGYALTPRSTSCSRHQNACSRSVYRIRPNPNEGSMTFGVNSRTRRT